jgi:hypothetical protein
MYANGCMKYVYDYASAGTPTNRKPCYVRSNFLSLGYCGLPAGAAVFLLFLPIQRHLCCRADALCRVPMGWSSWRSTAATHITIHQHTPSPVVCRLASRPGSRRFGDVDLVVICVPAPPCPWRLVVQDAHKPTRLRTNTRAVL